MGSKSNYLENALLDAVLGGPAYSLPATVYVALHSAAPTESTAGTELTGSGYARVAVTNNSTNWPAAASGIKSNGAAIAFPVATGDWVAAVGWGILDASSSGNLLYYGSLGADAGKIFIAATSDTLTAPGHALVVDDAVRIFTILGVTLPTGISESTTYYIKTSATDTVTLSATQGGATLDVTASGGGLICKLTPRTVLSGDAALFPIGSIILSED